MTKKTEIKYDGSIEEMMRLGLVDESGTEINSRRNELNEYLNQVWLKNHPNDLKPVTPEFPKKEKMDTYFAGREKKKTERTTKRKSILNKIFGRNK